MYLAFCREVPGWKASKMGYVTLFDKCARDYELF